MIELLTKAYWMEIETVMSHIANSTNPDGILAQPIAAALRADIQEELTHAQQFTTRIKELYGVVPGSMSFSAEQTFLQPPADQTDIGHVIRGVIDAESGAIDHYNRIIEATEECDPVTNDMVITSSPTRRATCACSRASCATTAGTASAEAASPAPLRAASRGSDGLRRVRRLDRHVDVGVGLRDARRHRVARRRGIGRRNGIGRHDGRVGHDRADGLARRRHLQLGRCDKVDRCHRGISFVG